MSTTRQQQSMATWEGGDASVPGHKVAGAPQLRLRHVKRLVLQQMPNSNELHWKLCKWHHSACLIISVGMCAKQRTRGRTWACQQKLLPEHPFETVRLHDICRNVQNIWRPTAVNSHHILFRSPAVEHARYCAHKGHIGDQRRQALVPLCKNPDSGPFAGCHSSQG